ncbi:hypothetical protein HF086_005771 [Spodoptera exigua]|uniref:Seminal fluid protein n=1 Tax=Spodoptera exigua TaxID=7107 RepID=A0A922MPU5_SPOEX|nr:hypothetical protein HF086_005771 [Spodoptera exigua]
MSSLMILFLVLLALIGPLKTVESTPLEYLDVNQILELFKQQNLADSDKHFRQDESDSEPYSDYDLIHYLPDKGDRDNANLKKQSIIDLIESVANEKKGRPQNNNIRKKKLNRDLNTYKSRNDKRDVLQSNLLQNLVIDELLSRGLKEEEIKARSRDYLLSKMKPNRVRPPFSLKSNRINIRHIHKRPTRLEDYSKILVVLIPQSYRQSKNEHFLNDLISKILSLSWPKSKKYRHTLGNIFRIKDLM